MENIEQRITEVDSRARSNTHRIDALEKRQDDLDKLVGSIQVVIDRQKRVEDDVAEIKKDVKAMAQKPAKRWDNLVDKLITLVVAAVAGFFLAKFGL